MRVARATAMLVAAGSLAVVVVSLLGSASSSEPVGRPRMHLPVRAYAMDKGIHKIRHVVIIMQENRSFDNYFGTYRGAVGIPGLAGHHGKVPCLPDRREHCVRL